MTPPVVLTIAGSDSGGGAGIQADLKTFAALGAFGTTVLTAVTAQNTRGVLAVHRVPPDVVAAQLDAILDDFPVAAVKVGMLGDPAVVDLIVSRADRLPNLVVDPVLVATSGARLCEVATVAPLLPYAGVLTPNRQEAGALVGGRVETIEDMISVAERLADRGPRAVVVTGSELAVDVLHHDGVGTVLRGEPIETVNGHGSGCTFSSAIAVRLAFGDLLPAAVLAAKDFVAVALRGGREWELGAGPGPLDHFADPAVFGVGGPAPQSSGVGGPAPQSSGVGGPAPQSSGVGVDRPPRSGARVVSGATAPIFKELGVTGRPDGPNLPEIGACAAR